MVVFPAPVSMPFELQRTALEQGQRALETGVAFQMRAGRSLLDGAERQRDSQQRTLALQHVAIHRICNRLDERVPGPTPVTDVVRDVADGQFEQLYDLNDETSERLIAALENGTSTYDDVSAEYLDILDEQTALLVRAIEEAEAESLEVGDRLTAPLDTLALPHDRTAASE